MAKELFLSAPPDESMTAITAWLDQVKDGFQRAFRGAAHDHRGLRNTAGYSFAGKYEGLSGIDPARMSVVKQARHELLHTQMHWDMVCDLRRGSEIRVDDELFYKDGAFVI